MLASARSWRRFFFGIPDYHQAIFDVRGLGWIIEQIGRSWKVMRNPENNRQDQVIVEELHINRSDSGLLSGRERPEPPTEQMKPVLRKLWPKNKFVPGDCHIEWHGFPLSGETEESLQSFRYDLKEY